MKAYRRRRSFRVLETRGPRRREPLDELGTLLLEVRRTLRVDVIEDGDGIRRRGGLEPLDRRRDLRVDLLLEAVGADALALEIGREPRERIPALPRLHLVVGAVL